MGLNEEEQRITYFKPGSPRKLLGAGTSKLKYEG